MRQRTVAEWMKTAPVDTYVEGRQEATEAIVRNLQHAALVYSQSELKALTKQQVIDLLAGLAAFYERGEHMKPAEGG